MAEENTTPDVTVESLDSALGDLVKAADATDLIKGPGGDTSGVEHTGTMGSDGKQGGGRGSYGPDAKLDKMMIGKFADLGFDANQIAAMQGALTGKAGKDGEEAEDEDDSMEGYMGKMKGHAAAHMKAHGSMKGYAGMPFGKSDSAPGAPSGGEPLVKSLDQFRQDPDINDAVDVSPFLEAMTARTAEQIDAVNQTLAKSFGEQTDTNRAMAGAMYQVGQLLKSQVAVVEALGSRLGIIERQPNPPKGVTGAEGLKKAMPGEAGAGAGDPLKKAEVLSTLSYMQLEKGIKDIDGQSMTQCIGMLEGGNIAAPAVIDAVNNFHASNPTESAQARKYH